MKRLYLASLLLFTAPCFAQSSDASYIAPGKSLSPGGRIHLQTPKISIEVPSGWEMQHNPDLGITLQLRGKTQRVKVGRDTYRVKPSINVTTQYRSEPIDETRIAEFKEELTKFFTEKAPVDDFQILQDERIDYKGKKDALLIYSSYMSGELSMMQMHFLVASDNEQYTVTYSDADELFRNSPEKQELAWNVATSIDFEGSPQGRYQEIIKYGSYAGIGLLLIIILRVLRSIKQSRILKKDGVYEDDDIEFSDESAISEDLDLDEDIDEKPVVKKSIFARKRKKLAEIDEDLDYLEDEIDAFDDDNMLVSVSQGLDIDLENDDIDDLEDLVESQDDSEDEWVV